LSERSIPFHFAWLLETQGKTVCDGWPHHTNVFHGVPSEIRALRNGLNVPAGPKPPPAHLFRHDLQCQTARPAKTGQTEERHRGPGSSPEGPRREPETSPPLHRSSLLKQHPTPRDRTTRPEDHVINPLCWPSGQPAIPYLGFRHTALAKAGEANPQPANRTSRRCPSREADPSGCRAARQALFFVDLSANSATIQPDHLRPAPAPRGPGEGSGTLETAERLVNPFFSSTRRPTGAPPKRFAEGPEGPRKEAIRPQPDNPGGAVKGAGP